MYFITSIKQNYTNNYLNDVIIRKFLSPHTILYYIGINNNWSKRNDGKYEADYLG